MDPEPVEAQVAEMRLQVNADVALVASRPTTPQTLATRQPGVEPLRYGYLGLQGLPGLEATAGLVVVRDRALVLDAVLQEVADLGLTPCVVLLGDGHEGTDFVQLFLGLRGGLEATATEPPAVAILVGFEFLDCCPSAVTTR